MKKAIIKMLGLIICFGGAWPFMWNVPHAHWMVLASILLGAIGSGIINGFAGFLSRPRGIDGKSDIQINQTWMMFILGAACNLVWSGLI